MRPKLTFWAQALDNKSPDHIGIGGEAVPPEDTFRREESVSLVSSVVKGGACVFQERGMQLTADDDKFVVEVPSLERDQAGRSAPIVCYGGYGAEIDDALAKEVCTGFHDFAKRIGRTVQADVEDFARAFAALKKNVSKRKLVHLVGIGAAVLLTLLLAYCLASKGSDAR